MLAGPFCRGDRIYEKDEATLKDVDATLAKFAENLRTAPADKLQSLKKDARHLRDVLNYLIRFSVLPDTHKSAA